NQNVPSSFFSTRPSIGTPPSSPAAIFSASGSDRFTARANSQNVAKAGDGAAGAGGAGGGGAAAAGSARTTATSSSASDPVTASDGAERMICTRLSALQSISMGAWLPVYSANNVVTPHGRGA